MAQGNEIRSKIAIKIKNCALQLAFLGLFVLGASAQQPQQPNPAAIMLSPQPSIDTTTPGQATAVFDPPVIRRGEAATYRVTFTALMDSVLWPEEVLAPDTLALRPGARGQTLLQTGGAMQPRTGFNYRARPTAVGSFTVPQFIVYVYGKPVTVPAAKLEVVEDSPAPLPPPRRLLVEARNARPFVGQTVPIRIVFPGSPAGVQPLNGVRLNGDGFLMDPGVMQQRMDLFPEYATNWSSLVCETALTPLRPGKLELFAQGFTAGLNVAGPIVIRGNVTIPGAGQPPVLLDSDPITLEVRPLPREGELPGFNGAIGHFKLDPPTLAAESLRVGDPVTLTVNVRGDGDLTRLVAPALPGAPGWQVFAGAVDTAPPVLVQARGYVTFSYTLIPTSDETRSTPRIPFSYFDPDKAAYVDLSVPSLSVTVKPGAAPIDMMALTNSSVTVADGEPAAKLSGLAKVPGARMDQLVPVQRKAWFPLVQLLPAVALLALWLWDRHRRFHEAHPEVMIRRRARRALRREWAAVRRAAAQGDTSRFAASAVNAMRVACAPHYPAEPRALVSSDVTPLLASADVPEAGRVVRLIFAAADAERFAGQSAVVTDLLSLRGELDRVLAELEARL